MGPFWGRFGGSFWPFLGSFWGGHFGAILGSILGVDFGRPGGSILGRPGGTILGVRFWTPRSSPNCQHRDPPRGTKTRYGSESTATLACDPLARCTPCHRGVKKEPYRSRGKSRGKDGLNPPLLQSSASVLIGHLYNMDYCEVSYCSRIVQVCLALTICLWL